MTPIISAAFYALASVALVGITIFSDSTKLRQKRAWTAVPTSKIGLLHTGNYNDLTDVVMFGVFDSNNDALGSSQLEENNSSAFRHNVQTDDFPTWVPLYFRSGWAFVGIAILLSCILTFLFLGPEKIQTKFRGWAGWFERTDHIQRGLVLPQLPIQIMDGIFSVLGPIFVLRNLELDVALLGALVLGEHAVQVLTQYYCVKYCKEQGNKKAQVRAVHLLILMSFIFFLIPFLPQYWVKENTWLVFMLYLVGRLLYAWGSNFFLANFHSAINNAAFLPPADIVKTLDIFFAFNMFGKFIGAVMVLIISGFLDTSWGFCLPIFLCALMYWAVETIPQDESAITFPPDPADIAAVDSVKLSQKGPLGGEKPAKDKTAPWLFPIWLQDEPRWLLIQFIVLMLAFTTLETAFIFMLPLAAMNCGLTNEDVGFLVAVPSVVGLMLFWLGSAFDNTSYVLKSCLAAVGYALAYFTASGSGFFTELFLAAFIFALTLCYSCDLVALLRICYLHKVSRFRMKYYFAAAQGYAAHLVAFNAPLITLVMSLYSVHAAYLIWGGIAVFVAVWIGIVIRSTIEEVTSLNRVAEGDTELDATANAIFDEIDLNKDQVLSREELLGYLSTKGLSGEAGSIVLDGILRITDRNGDGTVSRVEWRKSYAAIMELAQHEDVDDAVFARSPSAGQ